MNYDSEIAKTIVYIKVANNGAKNKKSLYKINKHSFGIWKKGYKIKDDLILKTIILINKSNDSMFRYYISRDTIKPNRYIVYFNFKLKNNKNGAYRNYQVSFHTFDKRIKKYISYKNKYVSKWKLSKAKPVYLFNQLLNEYVYNLV